MSEIDRVRDQLKRSFDRESWHGPAVLELLDSMDTRVAAFRPAPDVHSIWELVLHMTTWKQVVTDRIQGRVNAPTDDEDWPAVGAPTPERFRAAVDALREAQRRLDDAVSRLDPSELDEIPAGGRTSRYILVHGAIQHDLYHAGQIAILKKLAQV
jgi:uncharacterized damage-inducible protein DinB